MDIELSNSQKIAIALDDIFKLNHKLVGHIIKSFLDPDYGSEKLLNQNVEEVFFRKLSKYYRNLRELIREAIEIGDEMITVGLEEPFSDYAIEEIKQEGREQTKDHLLDVMISRIKAFYFSMNLIPVSLNDSDSSETRTIQSIYSGTLEESFRMQEYLSILDSLEKQIEIVDIEDYFDLYSSQELISISPAVYPAFFDAIADKKKYEKAESNCQKFVSVYEEKREQYKDYPEFKEITQKVAFLGLQEHYKKYFDQATGYLNPNTSYYKMVMEMININALGVYTGLEEKEIDSRIQADVKQYDAENRQTIRDIYDSTVSKYKAERRRHYFIDALKDGSVKIANRLLSSKKKYKATGEQVINRLKTKVKTIQTKGNKKSAPTNGDDDQKEQ